MSLALAAAAAPKAYWYLTRGSGAVALLLLTASVVLGVLGSLRFAAAPRWPRFAIDALHRDVSLLVLVFLLLHIITSVLDTFAPIALTDSVIPLLSRYRPLWIGFGALSFDLLLALTVTSLLRRRIGYPAWRAVHWLAYASWPVAVLHGLGSGSDTKVWWMLLLTVGCVGAVLAAVLTRIGRAAPANLRLRGSVAALALATAFGLAIFTLAGPLQRGWAAKAGTPASLLGKPVLAPPAASPTAAGAARTSSGNLTGSFSARLAGTVKQTPEPGGAVVDLAMRLSGGASGKLRVRLAGAPLGGGGLSMTGSQVVLLAAGLPSVMEGRVVSLQGQQFEARVSGGSGSSLVLRANLAIDAQAGAVSGTLTVTPGGG